MAPWPLSDKSFQFMLLMFSGIKEGNIERLHIDAARSIINQYFQGLTHLQLENRLKLRFSLKGVYPLPRELFVTSILFLLRIRFPLLLHFDPALHEIKDYDKQMKQLYQVEQRRAKFKTQFFFDHLLLIVVKSTIEVVKTTFKWVVVGRSEEEELYCLLVKVFIGVDVYHSCFTLLEKKYIDEDRARVNRVSSVMRSSMDTKRIITMGNIQAKLQKRRMKHLDTERGSILMDIHNTSFNTFKQELDRSLKVPPLRSTPKERQKYDSLEQLISQGQFPIEGGVPQRKKSTKKMMHTEQLSSSMKLNLNLNRAQQSYTKRDITLRHSNPSTSLNRQIYQTGTVRDPVVSKESLNLAYQLLSQRNNPSKALKKTRSYWKQVKQQIRQSTGQMLY